MKSGPVLSMRLLAVACLLGPCPGPAAAYIKYAPTTLGDMCRQSIHIHVLRVEKFSTEKGVILFGPVQQLKALEPLPEGALAKHVIASDAKGAKVILDWAAEGKPAVMFARIRDSKAHVYLDGYWYSVLYDSRFKCWAAANGEPILLTRYCGTVDQLADAVTKILRGEEVVVPAMAGDNPRDLEQRRAKIQELRASLRILGGADVRKPDHVGTIKALSDDGQSFRLLPLPAERAKEPAAIDIQISERTRITAGKEGQETGKLAVGQTVSVVLVGKGRANVAAEVRIGQPPDKPEKEHAPEEKGKNAGDKEPEPSDKKPVPGEKAFGVRTPDRVGTVEALAADGKSFTLRPAPTEKNKEPEAVDIQIGEHTTITVGKGKLEVGQTVSVWLRKGAVNVAAAIELGKPPDKLEKKPAPKANEEKPEEPRKSKEPPKPARETAPTVAIIDLAQDQPPRRPLNVDPPHVSTDKTIQCDYDIVYVRAPRVVQGTNGTDRLAMVWPDASEPFNMRASTDLMLLHPDGSEDMLIAGAPGAIADPYVSFDAQWVYYTYFHDVESRGGADVYKVHVKSRQAVRLTQQQWTPNRGAADGKTTLRGSVYNMHPCPLPGGRVAFVSNRDGFASPRGGHRPAMQLFVMDDDGKNVEKIGHLNVGSALHPVVLKDGRIIFSSLESQGLRDRSRWGIWGIHPDGSNWGPVLSAYENHSGGIFHFQTQLSDESIVVGDYYILAMGGFGTYLKFPARPPADTPAFAPAQHVEKDQKMYMGRKVVGPLPFKPYGMEVLTHFMHAHDSAVVADPKDPQSHFVGRVTQPSGAPDNHVLTVWTGAWSPPGQRGSRTLFYPDEPAMDTGIYLIKEGRPIWEPGAMLRVRNDPNYNEQWPRPLVPYRRIYGVSEPRHLPAVRNDGQLSKHLPEGSPFGLIGSSSLYKRESYPKGVVPAGSVTATSGPYAVFPTRESVTNWTLQGSDAGLYGNSDIHALRILAMEPPSVPSAGRFANPAGERFRILGEFPVRKFGRESEQPIDPDGNPDTSFLAKIPADVAWTFQTLDRHGMVLNMAQTWHQLRPGEKRTDCGGCHSHSQRPTRFEDTFAARPDYPPFDLTRLTPLLTSKQKDESGKKWDADDTTGLRHLQGVVNVEFHRDIRPILERSCVACHTGKSEKPAGDLVLDDDTVRDGRPATYSALVRAKDRASEPYVWPFRSRNSVLTSKLLGRRIDGFPEKVLPGSENSYRGYLVRGGVPWEGFKGSVMPPPEAVAGTYEGPDGRKIKVAPLTDDDRRTLFRWIDLGCPVDLYDTKNSGKRGLGWMLDDQRPTLTLRVPRPGPNEALARILVGMHDYGTGLDMECFEVVADFAVDGAPAGENLAKKFKPLPDSRWELTLAGPITDLPRGQLNVSIKDKEGNVTRIERSFSVRP